MGAADIIPGVSGGTVALIVGVYERLVTAISRFDRTFVGHLHAKDVKAACGHVDARFLVSLGCGIALSLICLSSLMNYLLLNHLQLTFAVFSGLILASSLLVARMVQNWSLTTVLLLVAGALFAWWLVGLPFVKSPPSGPAWTFFCGTVGICAMILPGISGAFILLILGEYAEITGALSGVVRGAITVDNVTTIAVFSVGCAVGLISFSKFLRWLLRRYHAQTMAVLCGFMVGSVRKLWPFRIDNTPLEDKFKLKEFDLVFPNTFDAGFWSTIGLFAAALVAVFVLDQIARRS